MSTFDDAVGRRASWFGHFTTWNQVYFVLGAVNVLAAAVAAAVSKLPNGWTHALAGVAAVSGALLAFLRPQQRASSYIRAWRHLDGVIQRRQNGSADDDALVDAMQAGETFIAAVQGEVTGPDPANRPSAASPIPSGPPPSSERRPDSTPGAPPRA